MIILFCLLTLIALAAAFGDHSKLFAVIVDTSAFWFNYRHASNALSIYTLLKENGVPDDQIILMLADDVACNPRNPHAGRVFNTDDQQTRRNVYGEHVEVDYRAGEVTVETFFRLLTDRLPHGTAPSKRLITDDRSNILLFMTGHGGENFFKFQDSEEINAEDLASAIEQMAERRRFHRMLVMIDTCQAASMFEKISSPNVITIASSSKGESSYSYHVDEEIGVAVIDRFTFSALEFLSEKLKEDVSDSQDKDDGQSMSTLKDFADSWDTDFLQSTPVIDTSRLTEGSRALSDIYLRDFFTNRHSVVYLDGDSVNVDVDFTGFNESNEQRERPLWAVDNARLRIDRRNEKTVRFDLKPVKL